MDEQERLLEEERLEHLEYLLSKDKKRQNMTSDSQLGKKSQRKTRINEGFKKAKYTEETEEEEEEESEVE